MLHYIVAYRIKFYLVYNFNILFKLVPYYLCLQKNLLLCICLLKKNTSFCRSVNTSFTKIRVVFGFFLLFLYFNILYYLFDMSLSKYSYKVKLGGPLLTLVAAVFVLLYKIKAPKNVLDEYQKYHQ